MNKKNIGSSVALSERDTVLVLALLKNPSLPNAKLAAAAQAWAANHKQQTSEPPYGDEN